MLLMCAVPTTAAIGCFRAGPPPTVTLATTTSAQDTGLLDLLVPRFREQTGIDIKVVSVGTGQALELARRGDADVLLVHDPAAEARFMDEGHGAARQPLMYDDFILVGPADDPAGTKGEPSIVRAFTRIAQSRSAFVSRGDESGTHVKEKAVWKQAGVEPRGDWYVGGGAGMAQVLRMADQMNAYTLSDRGTFLTEHGHLRLILLCVGDPLLVNPYSVIVVNPTRHPEAHYPQARKFADFLLAPETQQAIAGFGVDRYGEPLFFPGSPPAK